jgi:hypothetical protein
MRTNKIVLFPFVDLLRNFLTGCLLGSQATYLLGPIVALGGFQILVTLQLLFFRVDMVMLRIEAGQKGGPVEGEVGNAKIGSQKGLGVMERGSAA